MVDAGMDEPLSSPDLEERFHEATEYMKTLVTSLKDDQLLSLYARFKQATVGKCNTLKPNIFDFQGRSKWSAWSQLGDMSCENAMCEYISILNTVDESLGRSRQKGEKPQRVVESRTFGRSVSIMKSQEDDIIRDDDKSAFDWCKEGNLRQLTLFAAGDSSVINKTDDEGLCLLHWSCDRGYVDIVQYLLQNNANIDQEDQDGQTALHYACTCEHATIVEMLVRDGANIKHTDASGCTPADNTDDKRIHTLLQGNLAT